MNLPLVNEVVMGFDIGASGGWCCGNGHYVDIEPIPEQPKELVRKIKFAAPTIIVAEDVHTMPGQGGVSGGKLMQSKGILIGIAAALDIKVVLIQPLRWIETFTLKRTKHFNTKCEWKNYLKSIAEGLCPDHKFTLKTTDAFLIWYYYARVLRGEAKPIGILT